MKIFQPSLPDDNPPNHLLVEPWYYHGDGCKITLLLQPWQYHGSGSKKSSIAQIAQNCQIHSEMEEKIFTAITVVLPWPQKQCNFTSITLVVPRLYQQMIWRNVAYAFVLVHTSTCIYCLQVCKYQRCFFDVHYSLCVGILCLI